MIIWRLTLAASLLTPVTYSAGVELSPSRHVEACTAYSNLIDSGAPIAGRVKLVQGDLFAADTDLDNFSVIWCAVRPSSGKRLASEILGRVRDLLPVGGKVKLFLAGFTLPSLSSEESDVSLMGGYLFQEKGPDGDTVVRQLYGGNLGGPTMVVGYEVTRPTC